MYIKHDEYSTQKGIDHSNSKMLKKIYSLYKDYFSITLFLKNSLSNEYTCTSAIFYSVKEPFLSKDKILVLIIL